MSVVELAAQSVSDTVEAEGIAYVTGGALTALIPASFGVKAVKGGVGLKGPGKAKVDKSPYSKEFIQGKIDAASARLGNVKVPVFYKEKLSTGSSDITSFGMEMKSLSEVRPQLFKGKGDGLGSNSAKGMDKELLSPNGSFIDSKLESDYVNYLARKAKEGKLPKDRLEWKEARDYWLNDSPMARGNKFNKTVRKRRIYNYHEIHLENGKRLDSYDPIAKEIISRKATDLDMIDEKTYRVYLKEMEQKYSSCTKIRSKSLSGAGWKKVGG